MSRRRLFDFTVCWVKSAEASATHGGVDIVVSPVVLVSSSLENGDSNGERWRGNHYSLDFGAFDCNRQRYILCGDRSFPRLRLMLWLWALGF